MLNQYIRRAMLRQIYLQGKKKNPPSFIVFQDIFLIDSRMRYTSVCNISLLPIMPTLRPQF